MVDHRRAGVPSFVRPPALLGLLAGNILNDRGLQLMGPGVDGNRRFMRPECRSWNHRRKV